MTNLFSVFEPNSFMSLPMNWVSSAIVLLLPPFLWVSFNWLKMIFQELTMYVQSELGAVMPSFSAPGSLLMPVSLFMFILLNNFMGLFPYIFTSSSHLTFAVSVAMPLWVGHFIMAWAKSAESMLAHLVPTGTPGALMPFMVLIELTSGVIRPLTLSVRLAANMTAGHLLLSLLSSQGPSVSYPISVLILSALIALGTLEIGVSLIQAYVFSVLSTLYLSEVESKKIQYLNTKNNSMN